MDREAVKERVRVALAGVFAAEEELLQLVLELMEDTEDGK